MRRRGWALKCTVADCGHRCGVDSLSNKRPDMSRLVRTLSASACWMLLTSAASLGAAPNWYDEAKLSQPEYPVRMEHNVRVSMRDGVTLSADIYRPDSEQRFPVLLWRTPYSNNSADAVEESKWY